MQLSHYLALTIATLAFTIDIPGVLADHHEPGADAATHQHAVNTLDEKDDTLTTLVSDKLTMHGLARVKLAARLVEAQYSSDSTPLPVQ